jgi:hypothetical protein
MSGSRSVWVEIPVPQSNQPLVTDTGEALVTDTGEALVT